MKTRLLAALLLIMAFSLNAQTKNYIFDFDGTKLGGYIGTAGKISSLNHETAGYMDIKGAVTLNGKWAFGVAATGLYYDKALTEFVTDGTYHLYVGYTGLYIERIFSVTEDFKFSLSILTGSGEAYYQYDKDYRKEKIWDEEVIDKAEFSVFEPGFELQHRIAGNFWLGITGSIRNGSPLQLYGTSEHLIHKFSGGISIKYGVF